MALRPLKSHSWDEPESGFVSNVFVSATPPTKVLHSMYPPLMVLDDTPDEKLCVSENVFGLDVSTTELGSAATEML
jgi:hypothetical protein